MKQFNLLSKFARQVLIAAAVLVSRVNLLPANISPLGSFGFFGNPVLYGASIVLFDLFIKGLYPGFWLTYLGFACYPLFGRVAGKSLNKKLLLLPLASFCFFLLSNLGVWWYWYDHSVEKLLLCYLLAVPFYARTLVGDLLFGYGYLVVKNFSAIKVKIGTLFTAASPVIH